MVSVVRKGAAVLLFVLLGSGSAHAGLIHDLTVTGDMSGSGHIVFRTLSGNSLEDVAEFSFVAGNPLTNFGITEDITLTRDGIVSISWRVDPASWALAIDLTAEATFGSTGQACIILGNTGTSKSCRAGAAIVGTADAGIAAQARTSGASQTGTLETTVVHIDIPQPGMLPLFTGALLLGLALHSTTIRRT